MVGSLLAASEGSLLEGARITLRDAGSGLAVRELSRAPGLLAVRIDGTRAALATLVPPSPGDRDDQRDVRIDVLSLDDGRMEYSVIAQDNVLLRLRPSGGRENRVAGVGLP